MIAGLNEEHGTTVTLPGAAADFAVSGDTVKVILSPTAAANQAAGSCVGKFAPYW